MESTEIDQQYLPYPIAKNSIVLLNDYLHILKQYNQEINLISRKMTDKSLWQLLSETLILARLITQDLVVDAGSGNGLLAIPIAVIYKNKKVMLVESKIKKSEYLKKIIVDMNLANVEVKNESIMEYMRRLKRKKITIVGRGFPDLKLLQNFIVKEGIKELIVISGKEKIKNVSLRVEKIRQKIYNIPFRNEIIIYKLERVSRETYE